MGRQCFTLERHFSDGQSSCRFYETYNTSSAIRYKNLSWAEMWKCANLQKLQSGTLGICHVFWVPGLRWTSVPFKVCSHLTPSVLMKNTGSTATLTLRMKRLQKLSENGYQLDRQQHALFAGVAEKKQLCLLSLFLFQLSLKVQLLQLLLLLTEPDRNRGNESDI